MAKKVKRLFEGFQPSNYSLSLSPDYVTKRVEGTVTITGQKTGRPSHRLTFHQHGIKITEATIIRGDKTLKPVRISHHKSLNELRLHTNEPLYPGHYKVTMRFVSRVQESMHGIYASTYLLKGKKQTIVSTQFESHHAREAFPCIDEPEAKATFDLILISPKSQQALSNMPAVSQKEKDDKLVTVFETTPKMSAYLLAFVYGDMQFKETKTNRGVIVRLWATKAQPAASLDFGLETARRTIEFFEEYYGVPYPLPKSDHVAIPDFSSGAMENWGLITYRERLLLADPKTASQNDYENVAQVVAHELSHQWFGDLVTMKWWDDLWLNESFAKVMEYVAVDVLFPEWNIWDLFITRIGLPAQRRDAIAGVQAVKTPVRHPDEISSLFDPSIVYAKGGRLINMLMRYMGENAFRAGLKTYFTKHAYGNTTGADLWAALSQASGKDIASFMDPWLTRSGFPVIEVRQAGKKLSLKQYHFLLDPKKSDPERIWTVPLQSDTTDIPALLTDASVEVTLQSNNYTSINHGAAGHYISHYVGPKHTQALAGLIADNQLDMADRLILLNDSSTLALAGKHSFAATLGLLKSFTSEAKEPVWNVMSQVMADTRRFITVAPELEANIKASTRTIIEIQFKHLGWKEKRGESSQDTKLRATIIGLGVYAEHPAITRKALELFKAYQKDPQSVPAELRSAVFGAAVRRGTAGAFDYLVNIYDMTQNAALKIDIMLALTAAQNPQEIDTLLARLTDKNKVRSQDVGYWFACLAQNRHSRERAWQWLQNNWQWIEKTFDGDKSHGYFPRYAASSFCTAQLLKEFKEFFEPKKDNPALARNIVLGIEELENRVAWLERDLEAVKAHFGK